MQSSFTSFLSNALGFSPHPPESVYGTNYNSFPRVAFLGSMGSVNYAPPEGFALHRFSVYCFCLFIVQKPPTSLNHYSNKWPTYPSPSQLASTNYRRYRNINLFAITYAFQPQLRFRLTPGGLSFPGNPWVYGERGSHSFYRYSCQHNLSINLQYAFQYTFTGKIDAPLPCLS